MSSEGIEGGLRITVLGLVGNILLATGKIAAGVFGHSAALIADGVESTADIFGSMVTYAGLSIGARPPDENHPWGHGKADSLAGLAGGLGLIVAAIGVALNSVRELLDPGEPPMAFTLVVLLVIILLKETLYRRAMMQARKLGSTALLADAWHHRSDALTSVVAFGGILLTRIGGPVWATADAWAALFACVVILYNASRMLRTAISEIMDERIPPENLRQLKALAMSVEGVEALDEVRVRKSGMHLLVDIHIVVDGGISVCQGHELAHQVKDRLLASPLPVLDALVHVEPLDDEHRERLIVTHERAGRE